MHLRAMGSVWTPGNGSRVKVVLRSFWVYTITHSPEEVIGDHRLLCLLTILHNFLSTREAREIMYLVASVRPSIRLSWTFENIKHLAKFYFTPWSSSASPQMINGHEWEMWQRTGVFLFYGRGFSGVCSQGHKWMWLLLSCPPWSTQTPFIHTLEHATDVNSIHYLYMQTWWTDQRMALIPIFYYSLNNKSLVV